MEADDLRSDEFGEPRFDEAGDRHIADRLEALEAEQVLQRAIELEAEANGSSSTISKEQLDRIAQEVGVDSAFVNQALGEVRLSPAERSRFAKWVIPADMFETITIDGIDREHLDAAITKWMTQREGLTANRNRGTGIEWDIDRRWQARTRSRALSGENRVARVAGGDIAHAVHTLSETEHVVAMESLGRLPLLFAKLAMAAGAAVAAILLLGAIVSGQALIGLPVALVVAAAAAAVGVGGARWWARGIRGALSRSLLGLASQIKQGGTGILTRLRNSRRRKKNQSTD